MRRSVLVVISCFVLCIAIPVTAALGIPAFPGAKGFGSETVAGRGGTVYKVTNLNDSGAGSLRAAVDASGPRVVVFEISGNIELKSALNISNPYITIAGQTAPSPGISVIKDQFAIKTHDVLVQHIRFRVGDLAGEKDTVQFNGASNAVLDHCTASWSVDGTVDFVLQTHDVTISNSIMSEALYNSVHSEKPHSRSMLVSRATNVAILQNLFAHNDMRHPEVTTSDPNTFYMANTVVYNYGKYGTSNASTTDGDTKGVVVSNAYITGPNTQTDMNKGNPIVIRSGNGAKLYVSGNSLDGYTPSDPWGLVEIKEGGSPNFDPSPLIPPGYTPMNVSLVEDYVLKNVGARPTDRDSVDRRIISEVKTRTGRFIDSPQDVGGWPNLAQNTRVLSLPSNPNGDSDGDGYTNLEEWLHTYAAEVEGSGGVEPPPPSYPCSDGLDNDNDGYADYPEDPGCSSNTDNDEYNAPLPDTASPSMPSSVNAQAASSIRINLSWGASTDSGGSGLAGYIVYRNETQVSTQPGTSYADTGLSPSTTYNYRVAAYDNAGNTSAQSAAVSATTQEIAAYILAEYFEAENMSLSPPMTIGKDSNASGGLYISPLGVTNSTSPVSEATWSIEISHTGGYYLWARIIGIDSDSDAIYAGIDDRWDRIYPTATGAYEWVRVEISHGANEYEFELIPGIHNINIGHGEPDARVDILFITNDPEMSPLNNPAPQPPKSLLIGVK